MDKKVEISMLCQIYGKMLTEKQYEVINDYYNNDLSLSEIAENNNITRQAVRDNIKSGEIKLYDLENKLGLMKKMQKQEELVNGIISKLDSLNIQDKKTLESIKKDLKKLI